MESATSTFGLVERIKQGDREAFTPLFEKYRRRLAVLVYYKLNSDKRRPDDVDEILQETFLAAFQDLDQFEYRSAGSFMRWLSGIADHIIIDMARFENRQRRKPAEMLRFRSESNPNGAEPVNSVTPSRVLSQREAVEDLLKNLDALPEQYREAIVLAKIEGLSTLELAERLGKTREAAALLLHRAIQRFRELQDRR